MAKPSPSTQKIFALSSTIGAVLKANQNGEPKQIALQLQINRSMKTFHAKAGRKTYWEISNQVAEIWERIAERHQNTIKEEEVPVFVSYLCTLVPPKDFKTFLAMSPYRSTVTIDPQTNKNIIESILLLDKELNELCNTKSYSLPIRKPEPVKTKTSRDKSKKQKQSTGSNLTSKQRKERKRHSSAKSFLQQRIEQAKLLKE